MKNTARFGPNQRIRGKLVCAAGSSATLLQPDWGGLPVIWEVAVIDSDNPTSGYRFACFVEPYLPRAIFTYALRAAIVDRRAPRSHRCRGSVLSLGCQAMRKWNACNSCGAFTSRNLRSFLITDVMPLVSVRTSSVPGRHCRATPK